MRMLRFTIQATGFLTFMAAIIMLVSHSLPALDIFHSGSGLMPQPLSTDFLPHLGAAVLLGGIGYLLFSWGRNG